MIFCYGWYFLVIQFYNFKDVHQLQANMAYNIVYWAIAYKTTLPTIFFFNHWLFAAIRNDKKFYFRNVEETRFFRSLQ